MIYRVITIMTMAVIGGSLGYRVSDRDVPTFVHEMKSNPEAVYPGEVANMEYTASRNRSCETHVERLLLAPGNQRFVLTDLDFAAGTLPLGPDRFSVPVSIPKTVLPGRAIYRTINCYVCNFTHRMFPVCDAPRDIHFEVKALPR